MVFQVVSGYLVEPKLELCDRTDSCDAAQPE